MSQLSEASSGQPFPDAVHSQHLELLSCSGMHVEAERVPPEPDDDNDVDDEFQVIGARVHLAVDLVELEKKKKRKRITVLVAVRGSQSFVEFKEAIFKKVESEGYQVDRAKAAIQVKVPRSILFAKLAKLDDETYLDFWKDVVKAKATQAQAEVDVQSAVQEDDDDNDVILVESPKKKTKALVSPSEESSHKPSTTRPDDVAKKDPVNEFFNKLLVKHACEDMHCNNMGGQCLVRSGRHIRLSFEHLRRWAAALVNGHTCTLDKPPRGDRCFEELLCQAAAVPSSPTSTSSGPASDQVSSLLSSNAMMANAFSQMASSLAARPAAPPSPVASVALAAVVPPSSAQMNLVDKPLDDFFEAHKGLGDDLKETLFRHGVRRTKVLKAILDDPEKRHRLSLTIGDELELDAALQDDAMST